MRIACESPRIGANQSGRIVLDDTPMTHGGRNLLETKQVNYPQGNIRCRGARGRPGLRRTGRRFPGLEGPRKRPGGCQGPPEALRAILEPPRAQSGPSYAPPCPAICTAAAPGASPAGGPGGLVQSVSIPRTSLPDQPFPASGEVTCGNPGRTIRHMGRRTTADTPLTAKQTRFAAAVANGMPKVAALREEYAHDPARKDANARKAVELAQRPNVAAEIRRLTWLSCPPLDDTRGMREHSVRVLSDLSRTAESEEVRLKAALALYKIAETTRQASDPRTDDSEQDRLLAQLRQLYATVGRRGGKPPAASDLDPDIGPLPRPYDDAPIDVRAIAAPAAAAATPAEEPDDLQDDLQEP